MPERGAGIVRLQLDYLACAKVCGVARRPIMLREGAVLDAATAARATCPMS